MTLHCPTLWWLEIEGLKGPSGWVFSVWLTFKPVYYIGVFVKHVLFSHAYGQLKPHAWVSLSSSITFMCMCASCSLWELPGLCLRRHRMLPCSHLKQDLMTSLRVHTYSPHPCVAEFMLGGLCKNRPSLRWALRPSLPVQLHFVKISREGKFPGKRRNND